MLLGSAVANWHRTPSSSTGAEYIQATAIQRLAWADFATRTVEEVKTRRSTLATRIVACLDEAMTVRAGNDSEAARVLLGMELSETTALCVGLIRAGME